METVEETIKRLIISLQSPNLPYPDYYTTTNAPDLVCQLLHDIFSRPSLVNTATAGVFY